MRHVTSLEHRPGKRTYALVTEGQAFSVGLYASTFKTSIEPWRRYEIVRED